MNRLLLIMAMLLVSACQAPMPLLNVSTREGPTGREDLGLGMIRDLNSGQTLTAQQLARRLALASRVMVGEQHDNPDHHAVQLWLLQVLAEEREQGSLLLEMINPDQQASVNATRDAIAHSHYPADLAGALKWQKGWDWTLYGPLLRYALAQPYPVLAANLDAAEVMSIYQQVPSLSGKQSTAAHVRHTLLDQIRDGHCGLLPEDQLPAMLAVQQQRDRRMAQQLRDAPTPALLFAGTYHVRKDIGVALHLADMGVKASPVVLLLAQVGTHVEPGSADYVWYTAALPDKDYCAQLRKPSPNT